MLAWAKFCAASDKASMFLEAKSGLNKAIQLNYKCVKAFYHLGQVYSAMGEIDRAYNAFQKVLSLDEDHVDALREVRIMEMRRKDRKGLFDRFSGGGKHKK